MEATANYETIGQWIDRSRQGDRDAFACLVRQYQGMVSGIALSRTGDIHQSEDLAQETFLLAWRKLAELDDVRKFPGWLCGIVRNLARNAVRRKSEQTGTAIEAESNDSDPTAPLMAAEQNALITAALQNIPEKYREPLVLFYRGEQSVKQIAEALEITEETARQRLSRARKFLRSELERRIAGIISSTGPGEFFSLGVIAALPIATAMTGCTSTATATALTTPPVAAAVCCPPSGYGAGGTGAGAFSLWGFFASIFSILCIISFWFCWVAGLVPSLWLAVRNAPTLRVRRYLILTSLRLHFLFAAVCAWGFTVVSLWMPLSMMFSGHVYPLFGDFYGFPEIRDLACVAGWGIVGLVAAIILPVSIFAYRRVLREEAGLVVPKKAVPLEESSLSYKRLRNSFRRYGITILVLFLWMVCVQVATIYLLTLQGRDPFQTYMYLQEWNWEWFFRSFGVLYLLVGLLFLIMFHQLHRSFLMGAKDDESFAATPAIVTHSTPFRERVFIEWLVSFGLFIVAGLHALSFVVFIVSWIPRSPVTLFTTLILLLAITVSAAVLNARLPILRWVVNLAVIGLLFVSFFWFARYYHVYLGWKYLPFQDFFDSAQSYPVLFGLMVLCAIIVFAMITTMILGVFYLRSKTTGRFFSRRTIKLIFGTQIVVILVVSAFLYVPARVPCLAEILVCRYRDDWTTHHNTKMSALASEIIRSTSETDWHFGWTHGIRAEMNLRERQYDAAIADFDVAIHFCTDEFFSGFYYNLRGEAKFPKGDFFGALEDFDKAIGLGHNWHYPLYNRGFAHEKLGNIELALADYDKTIAWSKQFQEKQPIVSTVPRPGYDDESRRKLHRWRFGYVISFEELVEIRERLAGGRPAM